MGIYTGSIPVQRMWCSSEITKAYLGREFVWPFTNDWLWRSDGTEVMLLLYQGISDSPIIPQVIDGLPVTSLAPTACNYADIVSVTIPAGVKFIA